MDASDKKKLLAEAQTTVTSVVPSVEEDLHRTEIRLAQTREDLKYKLGAEDQMVLRPLANQLAKRLNELKHLQGSPYFFRCDVKFNKKSSKTIYFSKFMFSDKSIYSWVSPASVIRFEEPGPVTYEVPTVGLRTGILERKDQFLIVDGKIRFMATESLGSQRELIYQEYLSQRKNTFILPEIIEQMERAQDQVIRAHHKGSFLIAGPAGSGKTTLALHRIAYLSQSPDTMNLFPSEHTVVFVQDARTKEYFSSLLPQLGIEGVNITTFAQWAFERLDITEFQFVNFYGSSEYEQDEYSHSKYKAIQNLRDTNYRGGPSVILTIIYERFFSKEQKNLWEHQKKAKVMDRFDLTALLLIYQKTHTQLQIREVEYSQGKNGRLKEKVKLIPLCYSLMVIDETENYLAEQLQILRSCVAKESQAVIYVGDLAQQTQLCTIRDWESTGEKLPPERRVVLYKVYRSTKQILSYIQSLGYKIEIPAQLRDGSEVIKKPIATAQEAIDYVLSHIEKKNNTVVGILAKSEADLSEFKRQLFGYENVQILTVNEAQGVEFDKVFFIGLDEKSFVVPDYSDPELVRERRSVNRELIYVALTRAMNELHILSSFSLSQVVAGLIAR